MYSTERRKLAIETLPLHQVRPERGRHRCRARPTDEAFAQGLVQGLSGAWGGQAPEAAAGAQVHLGDEAGCRGLLPRAREGPRQDHAQDGCDWIDELAPGREVQGAKPKEVPAPIEEKVHTGSPSSRIQGRAGGDRRRGTA